MRSHAFFLFFGLFLVVLSPAQAMPVKTALFGLEFFDDTLEPSLVGPRPDQQARLALVNAELARLFAETGQVTLVDLAPQEARIRELQPLFKCNGCEEEVARDAGARLEVVGVIRKISNLILTITLLVRETEGEGRVVRAGDVQIRGNTDESWLRGVRYLIKNRIFAPGLPPLSP